MYKGNVLVLLKRWVRFNFIPVQYNLSTQARTTEPVLFWVLISIAGADPGFLERGVKFTKGARFVHLKYYFAYFFSKFPHGNEIVWSRRRV